MDFVAGTVEEARVDEADALRGILDAGLEVHRGAALLVHDADLHSVGGHRQYLLDAAEDIDRERDLIRAVHLRLDDVDRALAAVLQLGLALQVVEREQAGDGGIEDAFRNFLTRAVEYSVGEPCDGRRCGSASCCGRAGSPCPSRPLRCRCGRH